MVLAGNFSIMLSRTEDCEATTTLWAFHRRCPWMTVRSLNFPDTRELDLKSQ